MSREFSLQLGVVTGTTTRCIVHRDGETRKVFFTSKNLMGALKTWAGQRCDEAEGLNPGTFQEMSAYHERLSEIYRAAAQAEQQIEQLEEQGQFGEDKAPIEEWAYESQAAGIQIPVTLVEAEPVSGTHSRATRTYKPELEIPLPPPGRASVPALPVGVERRPDSSGTHPSFELGPTSGEGMSPEELEAEREKTRTEVDPR